MLKRKNLVIVVFFAVTLAVSACTVAIPISTFAPTTAVTALSTATLTPGPTPTPACQATAGTTQQIKFPSAEMKETFTFTIYLPPCYDPGLVGGYPVIYLLHGQNMTDAFWPSIGITHAADQDILAGDPSLIMVFPLEVHDWNPPNQSKFGDAIDLDLIPYVESHYNICPSRQCQAIGGNSRGAGWAMHIALTHFEEFDSIGAHSIGYFSGDMYRIENLLTQYTVADFPRIYMDRGDQDYLRASIDLYEQNLTYAGIPHVYKISPGIHDAVYWQSQVQNYIDWYEQGFAGLN
jgi:enterochelin esterase-like enzyme